MPYISKHRWFSGRMLAYLFQVRSQTFRNNCKILRSPIIFASFPESALEAIIMKKELTSEIMLTEPEDSKTGNGNVEFALADSASEVASFDESTSGSEPVKGQLILE